MQRTRAAGGGHGSRLVAKKMWRARSKSQSRASPATTSVWTPVGGNTWSSVTGRLVGVERTSLLHLTELERLTLQQVALAKLQALNLGCAVRVPQEHTSSGGQKKRRPYLLKRKALTTGIFENKKDEAKDGVDGGQVFGLSLNKCLENERNRSREAAEKAALAAAAASTAAAQGDEPPTLSRKSSQGGSHASFSSLNEATKQSSTGSLESLNLDRKRPSLAGGVGVGGGGGGGGGGGDGLGLTPTPLSPDLLVVEPSPQIPGLVSTCLRYLQSSGLHTLGLFRVSSSKKRVRQLREEFDRGQEVWLSADQCPHDVATLLKEFFRDLPEPLLTRELYEPFIRTQKIRNRRLQFEALQFLVQLLPVPNRDTLYSLLTFLATVAEHSTDRISETGEMLQGNKMDSSNLATLFAPNILHAVRPGGGSGGGPGGSGSGGGEAQSTLEMAQQAEEVISVVRAMIDHNKALFEVPAELVDETYQHLMDTHPEALDVLLRRRCAPHDDLDLEVDTASSLYEGSECSSSLPRSPTDPHLHHDFDRRRLEEFEESRGRRGGGGSEERGAGWFRRREKSSSREREERHSTQAHQQQQQQQQPQEGGKSGGSRWFRRRDKSCDEAAARRRMAAAAAAAGRAAEGPEEVEAGLRVPEAAAQRRLSSPEIDRAGVITASLRIPVPLAAPPRTHDEHAEAAAARQKGGGQRGAAGQAAAAGQGHGSGSGRQRSGSSDSYLGGAITAAMTFQPLSKKGGDRLSHDSVLSSSSADAFTLSPSPRNTPLSDLSASGASSPLSRTGSPPPWLSPDSGTPGLSPPSSPPVHTRRRAEPRLAPTTAASTASTAARPAASARGPKASPEGQPQPQPRGVFPLGRSRTADNIRPEPEKAEGGGGRRGAAARRYTRRRYTGERHPTGQLPDLSGEGAAGGEAHATLWKRWEIIASDPTEPETFV